jgi:thiol-disulfide isomerase/thioredoxin
MKKIFIIIFTIISFEVSSIEFKTNFTVDAFKKAQNTGKTVVVYSWNKFCTTCAKQKPILQQAEKDFKEFLFLNYEQTKHKDIAEFLNISYWSTIAIYKNNKQIAKAIGLNNKDDVYTIIKKGI